jgi:hypothetical protein
VLGASTFRGSRTGSKSRPFWGRGSSGVADEPLPSVVSPPWAEDGAKWWVRRSGGHPSMRGSVEQARPRSKRAAADILEWTEIVGGLAENLFAAHAGFRQFGAECVDHAFQSLRRHFHMK